MSRPPADPGTVLIVGAGLMGSQIALDFALHGARVETVSRNPLEAEARIREASKTMRLLGLLDADGASEGLGRVECRSETTLDSVDLIVESLPEDLDLKAAVLRPIADRFKRSPIATNTSSLSVDAIGIRVGAERRTFGAHYLNPPLLLPLVEVTRGSSTDRNLVQWFVRRTTDMGRIPIVIEKQVPGFIWNRLQFALLREAVWLVENGVASVADIDVAMESGLARRWRAVGPFATAALGGVSTFVKAGESIIPTLSSQSSIESLADLVPAVGRDMIHSRDRLLAADLKGPLSRVMTDRGLRDSV